MYGYLVVRLHVSLLIELIYDALFLFSRFVRYLVVGRFVHSLIVVIVLAYLGLLLVLLAILVFVTFYTLFLCWFDLVSDSSWIGLSGSFCGFVDFGCILLIFCGFDFLFLVVLNLGYCLLKMYLCLSFLLDAVVASCWFGRFSCLRGCLLFGCLFALLACCLLCLLV